MSDERITVEKLKEVIPEAMMWQACGENFKLWDAARYSYEVDKNTLDQLDSRLYPVIKHLVSITNYGFGNEIRGGVIDSTLRLLQDAYPSLVTVDGETIKITNVIFFEYDEIAHQSKWGVNWVDISEAELDVNGKIQTINFATTSQYGSFIVADTWLEKEYPGWKTRLATCEALDMPFSDYLRTILTTIEPASEYSSLDITFE